MTPLYRILLRIVRPLVAIVQTSLSCSTSKTGSAEILPALLYLAACLDSPGASESYSSQAHSFINSDQSCDSISTSRS